MKKIIITFICALVTVRPSFGAETEDRTQLRKEYCACSKASDAAKAAEEAQCAWCDKTIKANAVATAMRQAASCVMTHLNGEDLDWEKYSEWCPDTSKNVKDLWRACEPAAEKYLCSSGDNKAFLHKNLSKVKL